MQTLLLSASQIGCYRDECKRKWGFRSIARLPDPSGPAAALGTEVDDTQLQPYLRDGRAFDYTRESGYIAASALAYLPRPQSHGLEVQKHFVFRSLAAPNELSYQGYKDLWLATGGSPLPEPFVSDIPAVVDFKTTSNVKGPWVKTPEKLKSDVQAMLYATNAMVVTHARIVDLVWIYMQTKGARKVVRHHLRVDAKHVFAQFKAIDSVGVEMLGVRRAVEAAAVGGNLEAAVMATIPAKPCDACEQFNGCPYRSRCNFSPADYQSELPALESINMNDTASLLAALKAKRNGAAAGPITTPSGPVGGASGYELSQQQLAGQDAADKGVAAVTVVGINPPESLLPPPAPSERVQAPVLDAAPVEPKRRGRPKGSTNKPATLEAVAEVLAADPYEAAIEAAGNVGSWPAAPGRLAEIPPPAADATEPLAPYSSLRVKFKRGAYEIDITSDIGPEGLEATLDRLCKGAA